MQTRGTIIVFNASAQAVVPVAEMGVVTAGCLAN
jgi:hypothetical protein